MKGKVVIVQKGTQVQVTPTLRLATGNFWEEEYVDSSGAKKSGMTAGLWVTSDEPGMPEPLRVHPGMQVPTPHTLIHVLEVVHGDKSFVRLDVVER